MSKLDAAIKIWYQKKGGGATVGWEGWKNVGGTRQTFGVLFFSFGDEVWVLNVLLCLGDYAVLQLLLSSLFKMSLSLACPPLLMRVRT